MIIQKDEEPQYSKDWSCTDISDPEGKKAGKDWTEYLEICHE